MKNVRIFYNNNDKSINTFKDIQEKLLKNGFNIVEDDYNIAIAIGGDGAFLRMIKETNFKSDVLYLGINTGTLGFAQEIHVDELDQLIDNLKRNNFKINKFGIQETNVYTTSGNSKFYSLNDIVINRSGALRVIDFDIYVNDEYLTSYTDGLIISTPTGSTAYNLSAGGPIAQPNSELIILTPVCPHKINQRSIILDSFDEICVKMSKSRSNQEERVASFDGELHTNLISGDKVIITRAPKKAKIVKTSKLSFFQVLGKKMSVI